MKTRRLFLLFSLIICGVSFSSCVYRDNVTQTPVPSIEFEEPKKGDETQPSSSKTSEPNGNQVDDESLKYNDEGHYHKADASDLVPHTLHITETVDSTCEEEGYITYKCDECNFEKHDDIAKKSHVYTTFTSYDDSDTCDHDVLTVAECENCHDRIVYSRKSTKKHSYVTTITKAATCFQRGTKQYTCSKCGDTYTLEYSNSSAHNWEITNENENTISYRCSICNRTKSVINAKNNVSSTVSKTNIRNSREVELKNAIISFDYDSAYGLPESDNLTISAEKISADLLNLSTDVKESLLTDEIYDFNIKNGNDKISNFNGNVTIRIPYELKANDDPDNIAIAYINNGEVTTIGAVYENGYVTFSTNHFSYYTVIKMSKEEVCELLKEHNNILIDLVESTCTQEGYRIYTCRRCGKITTESISKLNHEYEEYNRTTPTTSKEGSIVYKCHNCEDHKIISIPKLDPYDRNNKLVKTALSTMEQLKKGGYIYEQYRDDEMRHKNMVLIDDNKFITTYEDTRTEINVYDFVKNDCTYYYNSGSGYVYKRTYKASDRSYYLMFDFLSDTPVYDVLSAVSKYISTEKMNYWLEKIIYSVLDRKEENNEYIYSINKDKVEVLINLMKTKTCSEIIDYYFGKGKAQFLKEKIKEYSTMKISDVLIDLKTSFGIDGEGIWEYAVNFYEYFMNSTNTYNKYTISQMKDKFDEIKGLTVNELLDKYNSKVSIDDIIEVSDWELTRLLGKCGCRSRDFERTINIIRGTEFSARFKTDYTLIEAEYHLDYMSGDYEYNYSGKVYQNTDKNKYKKVISEVNDLISCIDASAKAESDNRLLTPNDYKWYTDLFNNKLGVTLSYSGGYDEKYGYILTSSNFDPQKLLDIYTRYYYDDQIMRVKEYDKIFIEIRVDDNYYSVTHSDCFNMDTISYIPTLVIYGVLDDEIDKVCYFDSYYIGMRYILYNPTTKEYSILKDDLPWHLYDFTIVDFDEIPQGVSIYESYSYSYYDEDDYEESDEYIYYKSICLNCGDIRYFKTKEYTYIGHDVSENELNNEYSNYHRNNLIGQNTLSYYWITKDEKYYNQDVRIQISYYIEDGQIVMRLNEYFDRWHNDVSYKLDSVGLDYSCSEEHEETECARNYTYTFTLKFNGHESVYYYYYTYDNHDYSSERIDIDDCHYQYVRTCDRCGHVSTETYENHNYTYSILKEATGTQDGYRISGCEKCYDVIHREIIKPNGEYQLYFEDFTEEYGENNKYVLGYYDRSSSYYSSGVAGYKELLDEYKLRLVAGYYDENNELQFNNDVMFESQYFEKNTLVESNDYNISVTLGGRYISFDKVEVDEAIQSLGDNYFPVVIGTSKFSGSVYTFVIE